MRRRLGYGMAFHIDRKRAGDGMQFPLGRDRREQVVAAGERAPMDVRSQRGQACRNAPPPLSIRGQARTRRQHYHFGQQKVTWSDRRAQPTRQTEAQEPARTLVDQLDREPLRLLRIATAADDPEAGYGGEAARLGPQTGDHPDHALIPVALRLAPTPARFAPPRRRDHIPQATRRSFWRIRFR